MQLVVAERLYLPEECQRRRRPWQSPRPAGNSVAFERSSTDLLAQAYLLTDDRQEAQDLVQEVFLRVWCAWLQLAAMQGQNAWLRRVLHNLAVSR